MGKGFRFRKAVQQSRGMGKGGDDNTGTRIQVVCLLLQPRLSGATQQGAEWAACPSSRGSLTGEKGLHPGLGAGGSFSLHSETREGQGRRVPQDHHTPREPLEVHPWPTETMVVGGWLSLECSPSCRNKGRVLCLYDLFLRFASIWQKAHLFWP